MAVDRRERYREQTRDEAKRIALRQLAEGGTGALSLNGIAREIGLSGPALYRYFVNRDALLTAMITDAYNDLGEEMERTAAQSAELTPGGRLRAVLAACRARAIEEPHRYQLLFGTPVPGYAAPPTTITAAHRMFLALLEASIAVSAERDAADPSRRPPPLTELDRQLGDWFGDPTAPPHLVRACVIAWARLHGLLSLEINGSYGPMGFDPALLYETEIDTMIASL
jgi:AcrR family transcriptional regulator